MSDWAGKSPAFLSLYLSCLQSSVIFVLIGEPEQKIEAVKKPTDLDLNLSDPGQLRDQALLQFKRIRDSKAADLPEKNGNWWLQLDQAINDPTSIMVLNKEAADRDDQLTLEALGILQIWVFQ